MVPVLIGVPLIAGLIWYGWGRKSENWILYAAFLAILRQIALQRQKREG